MTTDAETLARVALLVFEDDVQMTPGKREELRGRLIRAFATMPDRATQPRIEVAHETTASVWQPEAPTLRGGRP